MNRSNNDKLEKLASDVLSYQELPEDKFGSVVMIIMMIAILVNVIRVIQECDKDQEHDVEFYKRKVGTLCKRRGWFTKMRLKKILRKEMSKEDYKLYVNSLVKAILNKGESVTDEEILTLMEASK